MEVEINKKPMLGYSYVLRISGKPDEIEPIKDWILENHPKSEYQYILDLFDLYGGRKMLRVYFKAEVDELLTLLRLIWL